MGYDLPMNRRVKLFVNVAYLEGVSFLLLLFVAMPMKYLAGEPMAVKALGWIHGLLFVLYVLQAWALAQELKWPTRQLLAALFAAVLPFGPFVFERKFLKS